VPRFASLRWVCLDALFVDIRRSAAVAVTARSLRCHDPVRLSGYFCRVHEARSTRARDPYAKSRGR
jgi:hypothetical protein